MRKFLLFLTFLCLSAGITLGQVITTSNISGVVTDEKGQTVPGVTVIAVHTPTGTNYSTATRGDGRYNLPNLRVGGPYTITYKFIGYSDYSQNNISLALGQDFKLNAKLSPTNTQLSEVVVTSTQNKVINSSRTGSQEIITRTQIDRLPTISRSIYDYTKLTPTANGRSFGGRSDAGNNLTIDGALFNNSFGLSSSLGGQANSQPISLDAVEQIQVAVSPFDVTQGRFSGTSINTVTKSGTNEVKGSVYYYQRTPGLVGRKSMTTWVPTPAIDYNQRGFSVGGPIVKNKLFFFISGEQERINDPYSNYTARRGTETGGTISQASFTELSALRDTLNRKYGYNAGSFENISLRTQSDKITAKLDWNINDKNTLSLKYFYLKSFRDVAPSNSGANGSRAASLTTLPFFSSFYTINNNFNIGIAELNTRINDRMANKVILGYQALRDFRESPGGGQFPLVDILGANGSTMTTFGYEPFTANNLLNTDTYQFTDNFTYYKGDHEFDAGVSFEYNKYKNGFAPNYYGAYRFNSLQDFYDSANGVPGKVARYEKRYSALPGGAFPFAFVKAYTIGAYIQDKWQVQDNLKITYGLRADMPVFNTNSEANPALLNLDRFRDGVRLDVSQYPKTRIQLSPRAGFNWDVNNDGVTQLRGGIGIFSGPTPFVYISNQASNNGVQFGSYVVTPTTTGVLPTDPRLIFNPDVNANKPTNAAANTSYNIAITDRNFKLPSNFRTTLAVDQKLPGGIIGTVEGNYSKDINAVYHVNVALPTTGKAFVGSDNRIRYDGTTVYPAINGGAGNTAELPNITDAILMKNTSKGYSYSITGQLQKTTRNLYASIAYTYADSRTVNDGGSIAQSIWRDRVVAGDPNSDETSYSNFYQPNRVVAALSYRKEYLKHLSTSFGLTYEAANNGTASYIYSNDVNGDGQTNDLIYIPRDKDDIVLVPNDINDTRTAPQQYAQLSAYIEQDPYLSKNKGKYAKRNGLVLPYYHLVNFNFSQDIFVNAGKNKNTLRFEFNIINFGNFLNDAWGNFKFVNRNTLLTYKGLDANGRPTYSFPYFDNANKVPLVNSFGNGISQQSRWQAQIGLRYIFN
ncbi:carboxypeptidase regulatory-like domain-containing protein [Mucilaginibacter sp. UR6-1]|uniref:TonB-dependent receptor n=1 Tax=Mucilaginibacter sp. UR6-1 TaxID=1435643 RepID=UPI001E57914B|nr:carboxypeptidase regulatory-like domain-containing protein [Mucilaginibacter sp. UR6-1]MCC8407483.1 carboxypeptidase regulatory-like domain-containing protein [Mucilaginibacter sp. UR6-1]